MSATEPVSPIAPRLAGPVLMNQDWRDLTFVHWAVDPGLVARFMPAGVRPDTLGGATYVGLVAFRMVDAGFGVRRSVPWAGTFLETNVRLYSVDSTGRRGVVFLSLDADRLVVVMGARATLGLPYRWAAMSYRAEGGEVEYGARLRWPGVSARSRLRVQVGPPRAADDVDHFVSARWGLHCRVPGATLHVPNQHETWPLRSAEVLDLDDELVASVGLPGLADRPPDQVAFSPGVHTTFGWPTSARTPRSSSG